MKKNNLNLDEALELAVLEDKFQSENKIAFFKPYPAQQAFFEAGAHFRERCLSGGNQVGKTEGAATETAYHLTGLYPPDWKGKRFKKAPKCWICGMSSAMVRDTQQKKLCGEPGIEALFGTGMIPKDLFTGKPSLARGIADSYDTIQVRHVSGGISIGKFKSYEQGREKHQGDTVDFVWDDEEPPEELYYEHLARLTGQGMILLTYTPLMGRTKVVLRFEESNEERFLVRLPLSQVTHFTDEEKAKRVSGYSDSQKDAREKGIPVMGSGAIYTFPESLIMEAPIGQVPAHWAKLWGIDFGMNHYFAGVLGLWDKELDVIHIHQAFRMRGPANTVLPINHSAAIRNIAANVPVAWPHDGHVREADTGKELAVIYRGHGLNMLQSHATWPDGGFSRRAAVTEIQERALSGRFKVARQLADWFEEFSLYHEEDGKIIASEDDIMSATEKIIMAKRFARPVPLGSKVAKREGSYIAEGVSENHWGYD